MSAKIEGQQNATDTTTHQSYIQNSQKALQLMGQEQARQTVASVPALKQQRHEMENGIAGYHGYIPNNTEHQQIAKVVAGGRNMIQVLNHMEAMINSGATVGAIRQYLTQSAMLFKGARDYLETGTRIEEGEQRIINQLMIAPQEAVASSYMKNKNASGVVDKMDSIRYLIREGMDQKVHTYAPNTTTADNDDPITGKWGSKQHQLVAEAAMAEKTKTGTNPNGVGQDALDALPNADGSAAAEPYPDTGASE